MTTTKPDQVGKNEEEKADDEKASVAETAAPDVKPDKESSDAELQDKKKSWKFLRYCSHTSLICLEMVAAVALLVVVAMVLFVWRITSGPVDVGFAKGYIEQALHDPVSGYSVTLDSVVVTWPDLKGPLYLELEKVSLIRNDQSVLDIGAVNLGLSRRYLLVGRVKPVSIVLSKAALHLIRTEENDILFSMEDDPLPEEDGNGKSTIMQIVETLSKPEGTVDSRSPIDNLQILEIKDARMIMEDHVLGMTWFLPQLDLVFSRDTFGLIINADLKLPSGLETPSAISADVVYDRNRSDFEMIFHVQDFDPHIVSQKIELLDFLDPHSLLVNGDVNLVVDPSFDIKTLRVDLSSRNGTLALDSIYDAPLPFEELAIDVSYSREEKRIDLSNLSFQSRGVGFFVKTEFVLDDKEIKAPLTLTIPSLPQEKVVELWPDVLRGVPIEDWMTKRVSGGRVYDVEAGMAIHALPLDETLSDWRVDVGNIIVDFKLEDVNIDYRAPLTPVTQAKGTGRFSNDVIEMDLTEAKLGALDIGKAHVSIDHVISAGVGTAAIDVDLKGPLKSVFEYISLEPIEMSDELGVDVKSVEGVADLHVSVNLPTSRDVKFEEVKVGIDGVWSQTLLPGIVSGLDLTGGPLTIKLKDELVELKGKAMLDGRPVEAHWVQYLKSEGKPFSSKVQAKLIADKGLRDHFGIGIDDWLSGDLPVDVTYTEFSNGRSEAAVKADVTPVTLMVEPFEFEKPPGVAGAASTTVIMQNGFIKEVKDLNVKSASIDISEASLSFDTVKEESILREGDFPHVMLEETDTALEFEVEPSGRMKMKFKGAFLDARPFLKSKKNKEPYVGPPMIISAEIGRMRTHTARLVEKAQIYFEMGDAGEINKLEMDAVAGKGDIYFRFKPDETGRMALRFEADDAGAALRAFNVYNNIKGGKLLLHGQARATESRNIILGNAELLDFHVINAPVLARLIGGVGLIGLPQLLSGEGIFFTKLQSGFIWQIRDKGDLYLIKEGRTSGSSLGITFEGQIDKAAQQIDITGHLIPMSLINTLLSSIPLIGDILSGGSEGGVFAATYSVKGDAEDPKISVNPLAALTPGIIRMILFE